jgi:hypothetical protein
MSAMSLVEIIRKARGADIAGAVDDLKRIAGFPEEVAERIATGELPMDAASVEARRIAQGYGDELYHGSTHDIKEFNGQGNPGSDWGQGTYLTDDVWDASTNYAGEGPDLTNRIQSTKEQLEDEIRDRVRYSEDLSETLLDIQDDYGLDQHDMAKVRGWADESGLISYRGGKFMPNHPDFMLNDESENLLASALTSTIARKQVKGGNEGVIYPVRVKQDGLLNVQDKVELPNYEAQAADELGHDYSKMDELDEDALFEIEERAYDLQVEDYESPNHNLFGIGNELDTDMSQVESIYDGDTWQDVRDKLGGVVVETPDGEYIGSGGVTGQVMARGGATGVVDDLAPSRFPSMGAGHHTIMFPGSENQIRSVNAAYDPQYKGKNIMGEATVPLLGLLSTGTAGAGLLLKSLFAEAEEAKR